MEMTSGRENSKEMRLLNSCRYQVDGMTLGPFIVRSEIKPKEDGAVW